MNEQISLNQNILICKVSKKHAYPLAKSMYMEPDKGYIFNKWWILLSGAQLPGTEQCLNSSTASFLLLHPSLCLPYQEGVDRGHNN